MVTDCCSLTTDVKRIHTGGWDQRIGCSESARILITSVGGMFSDVKTMAEVALEPH